MPATSGHFIAMLQAKSSGVTLSELDEKLAELVRAVEQSRKPGTLIYRIKISPNAKRGVKLEDAAAIKTPKEDTGVDFFFVGHGGALLRNDPNQTLLNLRAVDSEDHEVPLKQATS